jgi:hypothetical protein
MMYPGHLWPPETVDAQRAAQFALVHRPPRSHRAGVVIRKQYRVTLLGLDAVMQLVADERSAKSA